MADKEKLSDDTIKKVSGGDVLISNVYCPNCGINVYLTPMGKLYCPKCDWCKLPES